MGGGLIMKTVITQHLYWHKWDWEEKGAFCIDKSDSLAKIGPEYVLIRAIDVEIEVPDDFDPRPHQIATLREKQKEIRAESEAKLNNIEEQIQRLQCLEFQP